MMLDGKQCHKETVPLLFNLRTKGTEEKKFAT